MNSRTLEYEQQKNEELKKNDLAILRKWITGRKNVMPLTDGDLALFLHRNHYNLKKTKLNIESFFTLRLKMPEYFSERDPQDVLKSIFEYVSVVVLPKRTPEGYTIVLMQLLDNNPNHYNFNQAVKYLNMVVDTHVYEEGTSKGYVYICDTKDSTPEHLDRLPADGLKSFFEYMKNGTHFRWKGMYYVNSSSNSEVNEYLKLKIADIKLDLNEVHFYENLEDLGKVIPLELLPNEMHGSVGYLQELNLAQIKKVKDYKAWFKMRTNEADSDQNNMNDPNTFNDKATTVC